MENRFIIDNSVVMSWCFKDQANAYGDSILGEAHRVRCLCSLCLAAPSGGRVLSAERKKYISQTQYKAVRFICLLLELPI